MRRPAPPSRRHGRPERPLHGFPGIPRLSQIDATPARGDYATARRGNDQAVFLPPKRGLREPYDGEVHHVHLCVPRISSVAVSSRVAVSATRP